MTPDPSKTRDPGDRSRRERRRRAAIARARRRGRIRLTVLVAALGIAAALVITLTGGSGHPASSGAPAAGEQSGTGRTFAVPPLLDPHDVYAADRPGRLAPAVRKFPSRVYVPNSDSNTVSVINPKTYKVIDQFPVGVNPQHVVPSYDLMTLWVNNDMGNSLTQINPATGRPGRTVQVTDPYNLYFTPDGHYAIVVEERMQALAFRDAQTMQLHHTLHVPCAGVNHMDFTADGRYLVA
ncbi:MAG: YncE family protein, partial [Solirubrobacterales bacterium]